MCRDLDAGARAVSRSDAAAAAAAGLAGGAIVLLPRRPDAAGRRPSVAPGRTDARRDAARTRRCTTCCSRPTGAPLVATSGNLSDEPICTDEHEALARLGGIADLFLVHDRPIERHVDDSVGWMRRRRAPAAAPRARLRAAAGAPARAQRRAMLAVGAHLKNTVALAVGRQVFVSQHIGDLETAEALARVRARDRRLPAPVRGARRWRSPTTCTPTTSRRSWARASAARDCGGAGSSPVQHHHAHLAACLAENGVDGPGARRDLGRHRATATDGTIWGGEFLLGDAAGFDARRAPAAVPPARRRGRGARAAPHRARRCCCEVLGEDGARARGPRAGARRSRATERRRAAGACWRAGSARR